MKRIVLASILALVVVGIVGQAAITGAQAKKPGPSSSTASITLTQTDAHLGEWVLFSYSGVGNVQSPRIEIDCYQNGVLTFASAAPADQAQQLGGAASQWLWNGGSANCTAILYYWDFHPSETFMPLASTSFAAAGG
jgi:hypothetical protein